MPPSPGDSFGPFFWSSHGEWKQHQAARFVWGGWILRESRLGFEDARLEGFARQEQRLLESAWRSSTCNSLPLNTVAVKQYESSSSHKSLCKSAPFGLRRVSWSSKRGWCVDALLRRAIPDFGISSPILVHACAVLNEAEKWKIRDAFRADSDDEFCAIMSHTSWADFIRRKTFEVETIKMSRRERDKSNEAATQRGGGSLRLYMHCQQSMRMENPNN